MMENRQATEEDPLRVSIRQSLNEPPVLVAAEVKSMATRVLWDPNPQISEITLGKLSVFKWKDKPGQEEVGGLYMPPDFVQGRRYPLVIQNHGFDESEFTASGAFPTAFAAQELAAAGIMVLQVRGANCATGTPEEAPCNVAGYEAAVGKLVDAGLVDPDRLGIIGFSRTCYYVLEALTTSKLHFRAASITDGVNEGYLQYVLYVDSVGNAISRESDAIIGARPFGDGLHQWLKRSPEFNMTKVATPLQVVALNPSVVLFMWEPYAALRLLGKPVDLIVLRDGTHVLTNPSDRMISQGGTVDWFRFWLTGEEDADPAKKKQYARWHALRDHRNQ
jgi:dipeptidyl aminopeptidase/acylaminoacyl peptidase